MGKFFTTWYERLTLLLISLPYLYSRSVTWQVHKWSLAILISFATCTDGRFTATLCKFCFALPRSWSRFSPSCRSFTEFGGCEYDELPSKSSVTVWFYVFICWAAGLHCKSLLALSAYGSEALSESVFTLSLSYSAIKLSSENQWNRTDCSKIHGFTGDQYKICRRSLSVMKYVSEAVEMTTAECKSQLRNRRWNCSTISRAPAFSNDLKRGKDLINYSIVIWSECPCAISWRIVHFLSMIDLNCPYGGLIYTFEQTYDYLKIVCELYAVVTWNRWRRETESLPPCLVIFNLGFKVMKKNQTQNKRFWTFLFTNNTNKRRKSEKKGQLYSLAKYSLIRCLLLLI